MIILLLNYTLASKLNELTVTQCIDCINLHCTDHKDMIGIYTIDVLEAVQATAKECLLISGGGVKSSKSVSRVPGWTEFVHPYYEESKFWQSIW